MAQTIRIAHVTGVAGSLRYLLLSQVQGLRMAGYDVVGISSPGPDASALEEIGIPQPSFSASESESDETLLSAR